MKTEELISIDEFCVHHQVEISFISSLQETGLIEIVMSNEAEFINADQLQQLEMMVRFYYELDINLEGIDTITHLLQRMNTKQEEINGLKNRLRLYETYEREE
jgi:hypothetical protein